MPCCCLQPATPVRASRSLHTAGKETPPSVCPGQHLRFEVSTVSLDDGTGRFENPISQVAVSRRCIGHLNIVSGFPKKGPGVAPSTWIERSPAARGGTVRICVWTGGSGTSYLGSTPTSPRSPPEPTSSTAAFAARACTSHRPPSSFPADEACSPPTLGQTLPHGCRLAQVGRLQAR